MKICDICKKADVYVIATYSENGADLCNTHHQEFVEATKLAHNIFLQTNSWMTEFPTEEVYLGWVRRLLPSKPGTTQ